MGGFQVMTEDRLAIEPENGEALREMISLLKPRVVLEIGTGRGLSTSYMLEGLNVIKKGTLYTFDSVVREPYWWNVKNISTKRLRKFTCEFSNSERLIPKQIDFVFHDAGHFFEHVKADIGLIFKKLSPQALIAIHDVHYAHEMGEKVKSWFENLDGWSYMEISHGCGLGVARRIK